MGMPRLRQAYVPQPVVDRSAADLRAYIEGQDPVSKRPFMQEVLDGLLSPLDEADLQGLTFERTTPRLVEPGHRGRPPAIVRGEPLDGLAPDRAADGGARRGDAQRDESSAGQDRRPAPPDGIPRVLGIHRGESGGQRRDGGCAARVLPGHPRARLERHLCEIQQHQFVRDDHRRQRPDPQRDRDELGHRRDGPLQPCQRHDRTRLRSAVAESSRRVGSRRYLHGLAGQLVRVHGGPPRGGGAQSLAAAARAEGFQADRQRRQHLLRRVVHACRLRPAGDVAGEDAPLTRRGRAVQSATVRDGSDRGARLSSISVSTRRKS